jgi:hypothetical protein
LSIDPPVAPRAAGHPAREQLKAGVLGRLVHTTGALIRIFTAHGQAFAAHSGFAARAYRGRQADALTTATICVSGGA